MTTQTRYDTNDMPLRDRFAYWREAVCDSYVKLSCETENRDYFSGRIDVTHHSILSISKVAGLAHSAERRKSDISSSHDAYFLLSLQTGKSAVVSQSGRSTALEPGDMALYYSIEPYTLHLSDNFSQHVVQLPANKLIERLPNAGMLTARNISGQSGLGKLVRQNILAFSEYVNSTDPVLQSLVQETLIDLIATGLASQGVQKAELQLPEQQLMLRAKTYITDNLGDPELDRHQVATHIGMSVRRLNEIFSKQGQSLSTLIRRTRLDAVAADLRDERFSNQSISDIAFRYGFSNLQHFSTTFRTMFDCSPRDYRNSLTRKNTHSNRQLV
ncbi:MAG: helix-turn-helix domain-containing protein [Granulosicoccus sp.]